MKTYDLIVVGGGFAGCAAAISAARAGASVLLLEKSNALGGAAVNSLVHPFMPNATRVNGQMLALSQGIFQEICAQLPGGKLHDETLKLLLNRMVLGAGAEILFHATVIDAARRENRLERVTVFAQGRRYAFAARLFIDATGDANLTAMAGFPFRVGRAQDGLCQPMTLCFRVANIDMARFEQDRAAMQTAYAKGLSEGRFRNPREDILYFETCADGVLHFNTTRVVRCDPTDLFDLTRAEIEAREQVAELFDFLKNGFAAFRHSVLLATAAEIGIRESRMIDGAYLLTGSDLVACTRFPDAIAAGNYDIDIHNPEGSGTSHYYFPAGQFYTIPYRCLIPAGSANLLAAGRCISVDHEAQASIRIMPIVCCLGEAAGTASALALRENVPVYAVDIPALQEVLLENGAFLG